MGGMGTKCPHKKQHADGNWQLALSSTCKAELLQWLQLWFLISFFKIFAQKTGGQKLHIMKDFSDSSLKSQSIMETGSR